MTNKAASIHIGTSGWHYEHWVGPFYPEGMMPHDFLNYYTRHFDTVEINSSFYRLPEKTTFRQWHNATPDGFIFAVKASRFITHVKRLRDPAPAITRLMERVSGLAEKLGPILFQLPPNWKANPERLRDFLSILPPGQRFTFEFRDPDWFRPEAYQALREHNAAFCLYEFAGLISPVEITADFIYIRLHGPGDAYSGRYTPEAMAEWAALIKGWVKDGKDVYCYFDNDELGYAAENAAELRALVTRK